MTTKKRVLGDWGEEQAARFLLEKGYFIVERNFQTRRGEIDIIAWHKKPHFGNTLCFIEVKTRSYGLGSAARATGFEKIQHIMFAARVYCLQKRISMDTTPIQFENISIYIEKNKIKNIFHHVICV